jgi:hypothetical protein
MAANQTRINLQNYFAAKLQHEYPDLVASVIVMASSLRSKFPNDPEVVELLPELDALADEAINLAPTEFTERVKIFSAGG